MTKTTLITLLLLLLDVVYCAFDTDNFKRVGPSGKSQGSYGYGEHNVDMEWDFDKNILNENGWEQAIITLNGSVSDTDFTGGQEIRIRIDVSWSDVSHFSPNRSYFQENSTLVCFNGSSSDSDILNSTWLLSYLQSTTSLDIASVFSHNATDSVSSGDKNIFLYGACVLHVCCDDSIFNKIETSISGIGDHLIADSLVQFNASASSGMELAVLPYDVGSSCGNMPNTSTFYFWTQDFGTDDLDHSPYSKSIYTTFVSPEFPFFICFRRSSLDRRRGTNSTSGDAWLPIFSEGTNDPIFRPNSSLSLYYQLPDSGVTVNQNFAMKIFNGELEKISLRIPPFINSTYGDSLKIVKKGWPCTYDTTTQQLPYYGTNTVNYDGSWTYKGIPGIFHGADIGSVAVFGTETQNPLVAESVFSAYPTPRRYEYPNSTVEYTVAYLKAPSYEGEFDVCISLEDERASLRRSQMINGNMSKPVWRKLIQCSFRNDTRNPWCHSTRAQWRESFNIDGLTEGEFDNFQPGRRSFSVTAETYSWSSIDLTPDTFGMIRFAGDVLSPFPAYKYQGNGRYDFFETKGGDQFRIIHERSADLTSVAFRQSNYDVERVVDGGRIFDKVIQKYASAPFGSFPKTGCWDQSLDSYRDFGGQHPTASTHLRTDPTLSIEKIDFIETSSSLLHTDPSPISKGFRTSSGLSIDLEIELFGDTVLISIFNESSWSSGTYWFGVLLGTSSELASGSGYSIIISRAVETNMLEVSEYSVSSFSPVEKLQPSFNIIQQSDSSIMLSRQVVGVTTSHYTFIQESGINVIFGLGSSKRFLLWQQTTSETLQTSENLFSRNRTGEVFAEIKIPKMSPSSQANGEGFIVCYRPVGVEGWRQLPYKSPLGKWHSSELATYAATVDAKKLIPQMNSFYEKKLLNYSTVTWDVNDTREGTIGELQLNSDDPIFNTIRNNYHRIYKPTDNVESSLGFSLSIVEEGVSCVFESSQRQLYPNPGTKECPVEEAISATAHNSTVDPCSGKLHESSIFEYKDVSFYINIPQSRTSYSSKTNYQICLRYGGFNWIQMGGLLQPSEKSFLSVTYYSKFISSNQALLIIEDQSNSPSLSIRQDDFGDWFHIVPLVEQNNDIQPCPITSVQSYNDISESSGFTVLYPRLWCTSWNSSEACIDTPEVSQLYCRHNCSSAYGERSVDLLKQREPYPWSTLSPETRLSKESQRFAAGIITIPPSLMTTKFAVCYKQYGRNWVQINIESPQPITQSLNMTMISPSSHKSDGGNVSTVVLPPGVRQTFRLLNNKQFQEGVFQSKLVAINNEKASGLHLRSIIRRGTTDVIKYTGKYSTPIPVSGIPSVYITVWVSSQIKTIEMLIIGADTKWFGIGFGTTMSGSLSFLIDGTGTVSQRLLGDHNWGSTSTLLNNTVITNTVTNGIRSVVLSVSVSPSDIFPFVDGGSKKKINLILASGTSQTISYHGITNRIAVQIQVFDFTKTTSSDKQLLIGKAIHPLDGSELHITVNTLLEFTEISLLNIPESESNWIGLGFGKYSMDGSYAVVMYPSALGVLSVEERILGNHIPGAVLDSNIHLKKYSVINGRINITLFRPSVGVTVNHFSFPLVSNSRLSIPFIRAYGKSNTFRYHGLTQRISDIIEIETESSLRDQQLSKTIIKKSHVISAICASPPGSTDGSPFVSSTDEITVFDKEIYMTMTTPSEQGQYQLCIASNITSGWYPVPHDPIHVDNPDVSWSFDKSLNPATDITNSAVFLLSINREEQSFNISSDNLRVVQYSDYCEYEPTIPFVSSTYHLGIGSHLSSHATVTVTLPSDFDNNGVHIRDNSLWYKVCVRSKIHLSNGTILDRVWSEVPSDEKVDFRTEPAIVNQFEVTDYERTTPVSVAVIPSGLRVVLTTTSINDLSNRIIKLSWVDKTDSSSNCLSLPFKQSNISDLVGGQVSVEIPIPRESLFGTKKIKTYIICVLLLSSKTWKQLPGAVAVVDSGFGYLTASSSETVILHGVHNNVDLSAVQLVSYDSLCPDSQSSGWISPSKIVSQSVVYYSQTLLQRVSTESVKLCLLSNFSQSYHLWNINDETDEYLLKEKIVSSVLISLPEGRIVNESKTLFICRSESCAIPPVVDQSASLVVENNGYLELHITLLDALGMPITSPQTPMLLSIVYCTKQDDPNCPVYVSEEIFSFSNENRICDESDSTKWGWDTSGINQIYNSMITLKLKMRSSCPNYSKKIGCGFRIKATAQNTSQESILSLPVWVNTLTTYPTGISINGRLIETDEEPVVVSCTAFRLCEVSFSAIDGSENLLTPSGTWKVSVIMNSTVLRGIPSGFVGVWSRSGKGKISLIGDLLPGKVSSVIDCRFSVTGGSGLSVLWKVKFTRTKPTQISVIDVVPVWVQGNSITQQPFWESHSHDVSTNNVLSASKGSYITALYPYALRLLVVGSDDFFMPQNALRGIHLNISITSNGRVQNNIFALPDSPLTSILLEKTSSTYFPLLNTTVWDNTKPYELGWNTNPGIVVIPFRVRTAAGCSKFTGGCTIQISNETHVLKRIVTPVRGMADTLRVASSGIELNSTIPITKTETLTITQTINEDEVNDTNAIVGDHHFVLDEEEEVHPLTPSSYVPINKGIHIKVIPQSLHGKFTDEFHYGEAIVLFSENALLRKTSGVEGPLGITFHHNYPNKVEFDDHADGFYANVTIIPSGLCYICSFSIHSTLGAGGGITYLPDTVTGLIGDAVGGLVERIQFFDPTKYIHVQAIPSVVDFEETTTTNSGEAQLKSASFDLIFQAKDGQNDSVFWGSDRDVITIYASHSDDKVLYKTLLNTTGGATINSVEILINKIYYQSGRDYAMIMMVEQYYNENVNYTSNMSFPWPKKTFFNITMGNKVSTAKPFIRVSRILRGSDGATRSETFNNTIRLYWEPAANALERPVRISVEHMFNLTHAMGASLRRNVSVFVDGPQGLITNFPAKVALLPSVSSNSNYGSALLNMKSEFNVDGTTTITIDPIGNRMCRGCVVSLCSTELTVFETSIFSTDLPNPCIVIHLYLLPAYSQLPNEREITVTRVVKSSDVLFPCSSSLLVTITPQISYGGNKFFEYRHISNYSFGIVDAAVLVSPVTTVGRIGGGIGLVYDMRLVDEVIVRITVQSPSDKHFTEIRSAIKVSSTVLETFDIADRISASGLEFEKFTFPPTETLEKYTWKLPESDAVRILIKDISISKSPCGSDSYQEVENDGHVEEIIHQGIGISYNTDYLIAGVPFMVSIAVVNNNNEIDVGYPSSAIMFSFQKDSGCGHGGLVHIKSSPNQTPTTVTNDVIVTRQGIANAWLNYSLPCQRCSFSVFLCYGNSTGETCQISMNENLISSQKPIRSKRYFQSKTFTIHPRKKSAGKLVIYNSIGSDVETFVGETQRVTLSLVHSIGSNRYIFPKHGSVVVEFKIRKSSSEKTMKYSNGGFIGIGVAVKCDYASFDQRGLFGVESDYSSSGFISGLTMQFIGNTQTVAYHYTRPCLGCVVEVHSMQLTNSVSEELRSPNIFSLVVLKETFTVRTCGSRWLVVPPSITVFYKNREASLTLAYVDSYGFPAVQTRVEDDFNAENLLQRGPCSGNGGGGVFRRTNKVGISDPKTPHITPSRTTRYSTVEIYKFQFGRACYTCSVTARGIIKDFSIFAETDKVIVIPTADTITKLNKTLIATPGVVHTYKFDIFASDDIGDRSYTVGGTGPSLLYWQRSYQDNNMKSVSVVEAFLYADPPVAALVNVSSTYQRVIISGGNPIVETGRGLFKDGIIYPSVELNVSGPPVSSGLLMFEGLPGHTSTIISITSSPETLVVANPRNTAPVQVSLNRWIAIEVWAVGKYINSNSQNQDTWYISTYATGLVWAELCDTTFLADGVGKYKGKQLVDGKALLKIRFYETSGDCRLVIKHSSYRSGIVDIAIQPPVVSQFIWGNTSAITIHKPSNGISLAFGVLNRSTEVSLIAADAFGIGDSHYRLSSPGNITLTTIPQNCFTVSSEKPVIVASGVLIFSGFFLKHTKCLITNVVGIPKGITLSSQLLVKMQLAVGIKIRPERFTGRSIAGLNFLTSEGYPAVGTSLEIFISINVIDGVGNVVKGDNVVSITAQPTSSNLDRIVLTAEKGVAVFSWKPEFPTRITNIISNTTTTTTTDEGHRVVSFSNRGLPNICSNTMLGYAICCSSNSLSTEQLNCPSITACSPNPMMYVEGVRYCSDLSSRLCSENEISFSRCVMNKNSTASICPYDSDYRILTSNICSSRPNRSSELQLSDHIPLYFEISAVQDVVFPYMSKISLPLVGPLFIVLSATQLRVEIHHSGDVFEDYWELLSDNKPVVYLESGVFDLRINSVDGFGNIAIADEGIGSKTVVEFLPIAVPCISADMLSLNTACFGDGSCSFSNPPVCGYGGWVLPLGSSIQLKHGIGIFSSIRFPLQSTVTRVTLSPDVTSIKPFIVTFTLQRPSAFLLRGSQASCSRGICTFPRDLFQIIEPDGGMAFSLNASERLKKKPRIWQTDMQLGSSGLHLFNYPAWLVDRKGMPLKGASRSLTAELTAYCLSDQSSDPGLGVWNSSSHKITRPANWNVARLSDTGKVLFSNLAFKGSCPDVQLHVKCRLEKLHDPDSMCNGLEMRSEILDVMKAIVQTPNPIPEVGPVMYPVISIVTGILSRSFNDLFQVASVSSLEDMVSAAMTHRTVCRDAGNTATSKAIQFIDQPSCNGDTNITTTCFCKEIGVPGLTRRSVFINWVCLASASDASSGIQQSWRTNPTKCLYVGGGGADRFIENLAVNSQLLFPLIEIELRVGVPGDTFFAEDIVKKASIAILDPKTPLYEKARIFYSRQRVGNIVTIISIPKTAITITLTTNDTNVELPPPASSSGTVFVSFILLLVILFIVM